MSVHKKITNVTVTSLRKMKQSGEKIASLTSYDSSFTQVMNDEGVDVILVGDSLGMVVRVDRLRCLSRWMILCITARLLPVPASDPC